MGLEFYIADSEENIINGAPKVVLSEEIQNYIYKNRYNAELASSYLNELDPYADTVLESDKVMQIRSACNELLKKSFFKYYGDIKEAEDCINALVALCTEAINMGESMIAVGD